MRLALVCSLVAVACSTATTTTEAVPTDGGALGDASDGAVPCSFPPGAAPSSDASLYGCQAIFPAPSCGAGDFQVYCVGPIDDGGSDASIQSPAPSLGCTMTPQAAVEGAVSWCCSCGR
ncbi:MAG: hypothetical protein ACLQVI_37370 [Polyangiaceae bacterium]